MFCRQTSRRTSRTALHIREILPTADVVIGAVLIKGARAPILVSQADLKRMKPGAVIVDVAVDQGGCIETMAPDDPCPCRCSLWTMSFITGSRISPGAVPANVDLWPDQCDVPVPAGAGEQRGEAGIACDDPSLAKGLNASGGKFFLTEISDLFGLPVSTLDEWLAG